MLDIEKFIDGLHGWVQREVYSPLMTRIKALEERAPVPGPQGEKGLQGDNGRAGIDGKDGSPGDRGEQGEQGLRGDNGEPGIDGVNGKDGMPGERGERGDGGPQGLTGRQGEPGIDGKDGVPGAHGIKGEAGEKGAPGIDGKSVTVEEVRQMFEGEFSKWALDFERRAQDVLQKAIDRIPVPKDGTAGVNGKDGNDGLDGRNGVDGLHGKDGAPGDNGKDGFGFDDLDVIQDGERGITLRFAHGEIVKDFSLKFPVLIDRGVYQQGGKYEKGDGVTYGGSLWIAQKDTPDNKPGSGTDWRLAVKRGKDGKDGET